MVTKFRASVRRFKVKITHGRQENQRVNMKSFHYCILFNILVLLANAAVSFPIRMKNRTENFPYFVFLNNYIHAAIRNQNLILCSVNHHECRDKSGVVN